MTKLTGDPFVNTGLATLAHLSGRESVQALTLDDMKKVYGDGKELSRINIMTKIIYSIFSSNALATHHRRSVEQRILAYNKMTDVLIDNIGKEDIEHVCEVCGNATCLDIYKLPVLHSNNKQEEKRYFGREWFPLLGSVANDAQALPSASRSFSICAFCLFAIQYLPQGVFLSQGKATMYQCTSIEFWFRLVGNVVKKNRERIGIPDPDGRFVTEGAKEGYSVVLKRLLDTMDDLHLERREGDLHSNTILELWRFTNFGSDANCEIDKIPSIALNFIRNALTYGLKSEILEIINSEQPRPAIKGKQEKKKGFPPKYTLINCLLRNEDYNPLYPHRIKIEKKRNTDGEVEKYEKDLPGASGKLFSLYQTRILGTSIESLNTAYKIANYIHSHITTEELDSINKNDIYAHAMIQKLMLQMVKDKELNFEEYAELFLMNERIYKIKYKTWKILHYYLHNPNNKPLSDIKTEKKVRNDNALLYAASRIYDRIIKNNGIEWFKKNILDGWFRTVITEWLRKQFIKAGLSYDDWKYLVTSFDGKEITNDLLYCNRILFNEWYYGNIKPTQVKPTITTRIELDTDLSQEVITAINCITNKYLEKYDPEKFEKKILHELIVDWNKSLWWFKKQLVKHGYEDDKWQAFLIDKDGNDIKNLRRFQLQLAINTTYRKIQSTPILLR